jgi:putative sigma-54 modulation protein
MSTTFNISGRHVEITPDIESYVRNKLSKVEKIYSKVNNIHVILTVEKFNKKAEAEVRLAGDHNSIFAEAISEDLFESIDKLEDKIMVQVKKYHDKLKDHDK